MVVFQKFGGKTATLDSGINLAPGITIASLLKNFHITISTTFLHHCGHF